MTFSRTIPASKLNRKVWAEVDLGSMSVVDQVRFNRLKASIDMYLDGIAPKTIFETHGVSRSWLNQKLRDCVQWAEDGRVQGYRGLLKNANRKEYVRKAKVRGELDGFGTAGAWAQLLAAHPWIKKLVRDASRGKLGTTVREAGLSVKSIHREMKDGLVARGVTQGEYPFNTGSKGYAPLCKYVNECLLAGDQAVRRARHGVRNEAAADSRTGKSSWLRAHRPLSIVCYDEQQIPLLGTLVIDIGEREIHVPMQRCSLCLLVDESSGASLGYYISMRRRVAAGDVLKALQNLLTPWQPMQLTVPGLVYPPGAAMPAGVVKGVLGARLSMLRVDNDLVHYANSILQHAVDLTGITLQYGKLARPITRQPVEHVFAMLQMRFLSRVPSTTGSGHDDPVVDDPVGKAVKLEIRMSEILQVIDIALAILNNTTRPSLFNATPLEELEREFGGPRGCVIPTWSASLIERPRFPEEILDVTIQGSVEKNVAPYVEHIDGTYNNDFLRTAWDLIGRKLTVHIHDDFRTLHCFLESGAEFGHLAVTGRWRHSYHTKATRQEILAARGKNGFDFGPNDDPVSKYIEHLARQAAAKVAKKRVKVSPEANKIARMMGPGNLGPHKTTAEALQDRGTQATPQRSTGKTSGSRWRTTLTGGDQ